MALPADFPAMLTRAGLKVVVIDGWRARTRPGGKPGVGVLNHHTGASAKGWSLAKELAYAKWMFLTGRSDLPAPLCQIALGRSGTVYIGAAGRANHAGTARASGSVSSGDGNALYYGIEWMLSGTEPIPAVMMQAGVTLNAVLTEKVTKTSVQTISCHYQTSITGKWDIGDPNGVMLGNRRVLDVRAFRARVAAKRSDLYRPPAVKPVAKVPKAHRRTETMVVWNAYVGQTAKEVYADLDYLHKRHDPDKILLQEVGNKAPTIKAWAKARGYWCLAGKRATGSVAGAESQSSVTLVRKRLHLYGWVAFKMARTWIGPKHHIKHPGRTFIAEVSGGIRSVDVHMPTEGQGRNKAAWKETIDRLEEVADNRASRVRPLVLAGDWNSHPGAADIKALAKRIGADIVYDEKNTDFALVRGTVVKKGRKTRVLSAKVHTGTKQGSDHPYFVIRLHWR